MENEVYLVFFGLLRLFSFYLLGLIIMWETLKLREGNDKTIGFLYEQVGINRQFPVRSTFESSSFPAFI